MIAASDREPSAIPVWASRWLYAAGVYNLVWGATVIAFPHLLFDFAGIQRINYPEIWQCVGMIVGVYGVGYLIAAGDPRRHWPIVLVGLLGKVFGPIGFAKALADGVFPPVFGLTIVTNDLIWWVPFAMILWDAFLNRELGTPDLAVVRRFVKESRLAVSPAEAFQFHETPDALRQLMPPWEPMRVADAPNGLQPGTRVILVGRVFGMPMQWVAVHTEYDPPHRFADRQEAGPFDYWYHRHEFRSDGAGGTVLRDEVEYLPPFGLFGRWLLDGLIRRKLTRMFDYRHDTTRRLLETRHVAAVIERTEATTGE
jgi:ligand-binding SRPBCC domain-containing protein